MYEVMSSIAFTAIGGYGEWPQKDLYWALALASTVLYCLTQWRIFSQKDAPKRWLSVLNGVFFMVLWTCAFVLLCLQFVYGPAYQMQQMAEICNATVKVE